MNIYKIERPPEHIAYDETAAYVVIAKNETDARKLASKQCGICTEPDIVWLDPAYSSCVCVGKSNAIGDSLMLHHGYILRDFKAG